MAVGNIVSCAPTLVANNASLIIQPAAGVGWLIKNIYYAGAVQFSWTDGVHSIVFDNDGSAGARMAASFLPTNTYYLAVTNVSGASIYIAYDGVQIQ